MNGVQIITISALGLLLAGGTLAVIGTSLYDAAEAKRARKLSKHPYARALRRRPLISVIITAGRDGAALQDCLAGLAAGHYRKYELIIICQNRQTIEAILKRFETAHPSKTVRIVPGGPKSRQKALKTASGELVMVINQPAPLAKTALQQAADRLALEPNTDTVHIEPAITVQPSLTNLTYRFRTAAGGQLRKAAAAYGLGGLIQPPAVYRREHLIRRPPKSSLLIRLAGWFLSLLALALGTYGLYLAAAAATAYLLAILWAGLGLFLLLAVWADGRFNRRQKLQLSLLTPPLSGLLYFHLWVSVIKRAVKPVSDA